MTTYMTGRERHPSFGQYTKEEFQKLMDRPYKWKPDDTEEPVNQKFLFKLTRDRNVSVHEESEIEIEAPSEEEAREILDEKDWDDFDWGDTGDEDCSGCDNHRIESVKEI